MASDQPPAPEPQPAHVASVPQRARWALLDPFTARHARTLGFSLLRSRSSPDTAPTTGYGLAFGEALTTLRGSFVAGGLLEHELRLVPADAFSLTLSRYQWEAGPRLGPVEPLVRVGFSLLHFDVGSSGFSFGMLSPRVGAGLWLTLPALRLGVSVFSEYWWRWVGEPSAFVRGLSFELQPAAPPLRKPRATSSPSPSAPASR
ncbi:MAG TPA: hypothetical protein VJN18_10365 [Polyangiaceae bacterium]|nr:hypothetical protein [Polyangiaceae bacterium]